MAIILFHMYYAVSFFTPFTKSNLYLLSNVGTVSFETTSMNVFPMQMRCPPRNGEKLKGFLRLPDGVKK